MANLIAPLKSRKRRRKQTFDDLPYNPLLDHVAQYAEETAGALNATPIGYFHRFKRLPKSAYKRVSKAQPNDARCPVTLLSNVMRMLQLAHLAPNSTDMLTAQRLACILGLERDDFNLGTSSNLLYLFIDLHIALDAGLCVFVPSLEVLTIMDYAISHGGLPPPSQDFSDESGVKTNPRLDRVNSAGFIHTDEVFIRNHPRPCDFVPLKGWSRKPDYQEAALTNTEPSLPEHASSAASINDPHVDVFRWPFITKNGDYMLPKVILHNNPWLIVWNGYVTLQEHHTDFNELNDLDDFEDTPQTVFSFQLQLIKKIGQHIAGLVLSSDFLASPDAPENPPDELNDAELDEDDYEIASGWASRNIASECSEAAYSDEDREERHTAAI
ncbi:hypothetical protein GGG16DRAFT_44677 [Schizophyllum commune]